MCDRQVVRQDSLDRAHRTARVDRALGDLLRVNAAVEHRHLAVQLAPRLPENGRDLPLDLLGCEHSDQTHVVQLGSPPGIGGRGGEPVGAVEFGQDPVVEDALEVEALVPKADRNGFDLLPLFLIPAALRGIQRVVEVLGWQQRLATGQDGIDVLDHRDGEARVLRGAFAEPLQRAPTFLGW